jgi:hypothetical protein
MKGGHYVHIITCWCYSLSPVDIGVLCLESRLSNIHSTCYRSYFHNYLAAEKSVQTLLAIPDCKQKRCRHLVGIGLYYAIHK